MPSDPVVPSGPERAAILVIDDNRSLRGLVRRALRNAGYHVIDWGDPMAAIDHLAATHTAVSLALVDGVMPQMLGPAAAAEIQRLRPGVPIMLMSGHEATQFSEFFSEPSRHFIAKPFVIQDLVARIAAIVGPGSPPS